MLEIDASCLYATSITHLMKYLSSNFGERSEWVSFNAVIMQMIQLWTLTIDYTFLGLWLNIPSAFSIKVFDNNRASH